MSFDFEPEFSAGIRAHTCSEAYQVLSNPDTRAFYDKVGKKGMDKVEGGEVDPQEIFSKIFGGGASIVSVFRIRQQTDME